ncbi:hypothetical protein [Komagataeibacter saccharivorans]|uniref:hypothetical protein n=1 Tax=Komagataeibacter saccharivorans TaxID=265959 RepID=UPI0024A9D0C5|nr:hypothetical protein [Komagataeibacter saccharivorans]
MMAAAILCGQCGMLLLAAGSIRGSDIILRRSLSHLLRRSIQTAGMLLLVLSLVLQLRAAQAPVIALITWPGWISIEIVLATLACTVLNDLRGPRR